MAGAGWKQWVTGEEVTATNAQTYWQDQVDCVFASTAARDSAITSPSEGMTCTVTGTKRRYKYSGSAWVVICWYTSAGRVEARVRRAAAQSISSASDTTISYDTEDVDTDAIHSSGTFTVPTGMGGLWAVTVRTSMASIPANRQFVAINLTSSLTGVTQNFRNPCTGEDIGSCAGVFPLAAADTFTTSIFHTNGSSINLNTAWCEVVRLGA